MKQIDKIYSPGTVVTLNIIKQKSRQSTHIMITRRFVLNPNANDKTYYEYEGILLPNGSQDGSLLLFNNSNIEEVIFEGFINDKEFLYVNQSLKKIEDNNFKLIEVN